MKQEHELSQLPANPTGGMGRLPPFRTTRQAPLPTFDRFDGYIVFKSSRATSKVTPEIDTGDETRQRHSTTPEPQAHTDVAYHGETLGTSHASQRGPAPQETTPEASTSHRGKRGIFATIIRALPSLSAGLAALAAILYFVAYSMLLRSMWLDSLQDKPDHAFYRVKCAIIDTEARLLGDIGSQMVLIDAGCPHIFLPPGSSPRPGMTQRTAPNKGRPDAFPEHEFQTTTPLSLLGRTP
ncbi:MAG: hypothetical protein AAFY35_12120 [Pseudomonadota bacterium]